MSWCKPARSMAIKKSKEDISLQAMLFENGTYYDQQTMFNAQSMVRNKNNPIKKGHFNVAFWSADRMLCFRSKWNRFHSFLTHMLRDSFRHVEHRDLSFTA